MTAGGKCVRCGKQMKWTGSIRLHCEHCGQLQIWPVPSEENKGTMKNIISDADLERHYSAKYYEDGSDYFEPPERSEDGEAFDFDERDAAEHVAGV